MLITFLGHASLQIEIQGKFLLVDPFITANEKAEHINIYDLKADYILLTHAHQDHILDAEVIAKNTGATIISNYEIVTHYGKLGIDGHPMNIGGSWEFDFGKLKMTNAIHSSSFEDGTYGGNPAGFVIESPEGNIYIAGDTALTIDMQIIPLETKIDLAVLPIGDNFTMGIQDAIFASDFIRCNNILGYHYDTFGYIEINHQKAIDAFKAKNKDLTLLEIGKSMVVLPS